MQVQPYLFFDGKCDEALAFYKKAVGAEPNMVMRYKDAPDQSMIKPETKDKVMHASVKLGDTMVLMSDGHCQNQAHFQGFSLAVTAKDETEAERVFGGLSDGGNVTMPMAKTFFSPRFGMLTDKFGVGWIVLVGQ
jgi:PhnB protein